MHPDSMNISDPFEKLIGKYKLHPSMLFINDNKVDNNKSS